MMMTDGAISSDEQAEFRWSIAGQQQMERDEISVKSQSAQKLQNCIHDLELKVNNLLQSKEKLINQQQQQIFKLQITLNHFVAKQRQKIKESFPSYWEDLGELRRDIDMIKEQLNEDMYTISCEKYKPQLDKCEMRFQYLDQQHFKYQQNSRPQTVDCERILNLLNSAIIFEPSNQFEEEEEKYFPNETYIRNSNVDQSITGIPHSQSQQPPPHSMPDRSKSDYNIKLANKAQYTRKSMVPNKLPSLIEAASHQEPDFATSNGTHLIQPCLSQQQFLIFTVKNLQKKKLDSTKKIVQKVGISHFAALIKENTLLLTGGERLTNNRFSSEIQTFKRVTKLTVTKELIRCNDLLCSRSQHSICSHFKSPLLFVTGGFMTNPSRCTADCEVYHWTKDEWEMIQPMPKPLAQHASVTLGPETVYTFCGSRTHGLSYDVKFVNDVSRQAAFISRYYRSQNMWQQVKLTDDFESIPAIGHLTAVELIPNKSIMLFGNGFVKNKGNKTGVILFQNLDKDLCIKKSLVDTSKKVPILNGAERPVLINWDKEYKSGVIWSFSMSPQMSEFTIMKFEFDSDNYNGSWVDIGKKEIKLR